MTDLRVQCLHNLQQELQQLGLASSSAELEAKARLGESDIYAETTKISAQQPTMPVAAVYNRVYSEFLTALRSKARPGGPLAAAPAAAVAPAAVAPAAAAAASGARLLVAQAEIEDQGVGRADVVDTFADYEPKNQEIAELGAPHPDPVVETSAMASVPAPRFRSKDATKAMRLALPAEVIKLKKLSALQLESIIYAKLRHATFLENGARSGFLLGDGAGMGKGRQIAGLITENYIRGRKRAVWFSASADLISDAKRDFADIGAEKIPLLCLGDQGFGGQLAKIFPEGVLFCTYSCLIRAGKVRGSKYTRLAMLCDWFHKDFDGVLVFDECHKAKNVNVKDPRKGSKTAQNVQAVQELLPQARVVYVSATGASALGHVGYMSRLGLWGKGTSFKDSKTFAASIGKRGTGAMELVAMDLKARGLLLARSLSYRGAEFRMEHIPLSPAFKHLYDQCCLLWYDLRAVVDRTAQRSADQAKRLNSTYWSSHQRFFREMCLAAKRERLVVLAKDALAKGLCIVIGLQTTGEARQREFFNQMPAGSAELDALVSTAELLLRAAIEKCCEDEGEDEARDALQARVRGLKFPPNVLDDLIDKLGGPEEVAEMTGRRERIVRRGDKYVLEKRTKPLESQDATDEFNSVNIAERKCFQDGRKLVAIISDAASTGVSLQADARARNQKRRFHITLELPWAADKAVQQLGRSHRSNQSSAPIFCLLISEIGAERRFAAAVAARLSQLGALTKGDRRATANIQQGESTGGMDAFAIDSKLGLEALKKMFTNLLTMSNPNAKTMPYAVHSEFLLETVDSDEAEDELQKQLSPAKCLAFAKRALVLFNKVSLVDFKRRMPILPQQKDKAVERFLNRLFGIPIDDQHKAFTFFADTLDAVKHDAKVAGGSAEGIVDVAGEGFAIVDATTVWKDPQSGATADLMTYSVDRGVSWDDVKQRYDAAKEEGRRALFCYRKARPVGYPATSTFRAIVFVVRKTRDYSRSRRDSSSRFFRMIKPNSGFQGRDMHQTHLRSDYKTISDLGKAERMWREQYEASETRCIHHQPCLKDGCMYGIRKKQQYIISGALLGIWDHIVDAYDSSDSTHDKEMKIVRLTIDEQRCVGIHIASAEIASAIKSACGPPAASSGEAVHDPCAAGSDAETEDEASPCLDPSAPPTANTVGSGPKRKVALGLARNPPAAAIPLPVDDDEYLVDIDTAVGEHKVDLAKSALWEQLHNMPFQFNFSPAAMQPGRRRRRQAPSDADRKRKRKTAHAGPGAAPAPKRPKKSPAHGEPNAQANEENDDPDWGDTFSDASMTEQDAELNLEERKIKLSDDKEVIKEVIIHQVQKPNETPRTIAEHYKHYNTDVGEIVRWNIQRTSGPDVPEADRGRWRGLKADSKLLVDETYIEVPLRRKVGVPAGKRDLLGSGHRGSVGVTGTGVKADQASHAKQKVTIRLDTSDDSDDDDDIGPSRAKMELKSLIGAPARRPSPSSPSSHSAPEGSPTPQGPVMFSAGAVGSSAIADTQSPGFFAVPKFILRSQSESSTQAAEGHTRDEPGAMTPAKAPLCRAQERPKQAIIILSSDDESIELDDRNAGYGTDDLDDDVHEADGVQRRSEVQGNIDLEESELLDSVGGVELQSLRVVSSQDVLHEETETPTLPAIFGLPGALEAGPDACEDEVAGAEISGVLERASQEFDMQVKREITGHALMTDTESVASVDLENEHHDVLDALPSRRFRLVQTNGPKYVVSAADERIVVQVREETRKVLIGRQSRYYRLDVLRGGGGEVEPIKLTKEHVGKLIYLGRKDPSSSKTVGVTTDQRISRKHCELKYSLVPNSSAVRRCSADLPVYVNYQEVEFTPEAERATGNHGWVAVPDGALISLLPSRAGGPADTPQSSAKGYTRAKEILESNPEGAVDIRFMPYLKPGMLQAEATQYVRIICDKHEVSRSHCELRYHKESGTWKVLDLGSVNGVFVNRKKIAKRVPVGIAVGEELAIGGGNDGEYPCGARLRHIKPHVYAFKLELA